MRFYLLCTLDKMNNTSTACTVRLCLKFTVTYRKKKPSKILFILFTVNYCNMHCIEGIFNEIYSNIL